MSSMNNNDLPIDRTTDLKIEYSLHSSLHIPLTETIGEVPNSATYTYDWLMTRLSINQPSVDGWSPY